MQDDRYAGLAGRPQNRAADVTAGADGHVRPELLENPAAGAAGPAGLKQRLDIVPQRVQRAFMLEALHVQQPDIVAGLRYDGGFHLSLHADEEELRLRMMLPDAGGDRQRRLNVAGGPSAGKQYSHRYTLLCVCLDMERITPIWASSISSEVPP